MNPPITTKRGRPLKISSRQIRTVKRSLKKTPSSVPQLIHHYQINSSRWTLARALKRNNVVRRKLKRITILKDNHISARLSFAREHMSWHEKWHNVLFTDEKKFNCDGPDGYRYFWYALGSQYPYYSKRIGNGGSLMLWCGFMSDKFILFQFIRGTITANKYQQMLDDLNIKIMLEQGTRNAESGILQHDNAPAHVVSHFYKK